MTQKLGPQPDLIASTGKVGQFKVAQPDLLILDFRARLIDSVAELEPAGRLLESVVRNGDSRQSVF